MSSNFGLFISTFATLIAVVNPLEAMPVFLSLLEGKDDREHRRVVFASCAYATGLMVFFLLFGTLIMKFFGVPLSMVRIAGGIVLTRIGFELFSPSKPKDPKAASQAKEGANIAFAPLAMPIMFGPGVIATVIGMAATVKSPHAGIDLRPLLEISAAILAAGFVTYLCLLFAGVLSAKLGAAVIDALTKIVGFFVSAMGVGLVFDGVMEAIENHAWH
jgi:multiple antibiotic resistance protein